MQTAWTLLALVAGASACSSQGANDARQNLLEKMNNANGESSAGADYYKGASAATLYIYIEYENGAARTIEDSGNGFGCKVSIHEYIHVLQQGFLTGNLNSLTPPTDTLGNNRFQIRNPANLPAVFGTKILAAMNALPSSLKLLTVPTIIILIPSITGGVGSTSLADSEATAIMAIEFPNNCAGVDFRFDWAQWENNPMAEGEAEYYAENVYIGLNSAIQAWTVPYDGAGQWAQRVQDGTAMLTAPNPHGTNRQTLHLGDGMQAAVTAMENAGWRPNPIGELTYHYLKTQWRTSTTHAELLEIWRQAPVAGYAAAFATVMGKTWTKFVCDFEVYHSITHTTPSSATCAAANVSPPPSPPPIPPWAPGAVPSPPPPPPRPPGSGSGGGGGGGDGPSGGMIAGIAVGAVAVIGIIGGGIAYNMRAKGKSVEVKKDEIQVGDAA